MYVYVHVYIHNTKDFLALNLEISKTNWHLTAIANNGNSAFTFGSQPNG